MWRRVSGASPSFKKRSMAALVVGRDCAWPTAAPVVAGIGGGVALLGVGVPFLADDAGGGWTLEMLDEAEVTEDAVKPIADLLLLLLVVLLFNNFSAIEPGGGPVGMALTLAC